MMTRFHFSRGPYGDDDLLRITVKVNGLYVNHIWVQNGSIDMSGTDVFIRDNKGIAVTVLPVTECVGLTDVMQ